MEPLQLYDYLTLARTRVLDAAAGLPEEMHTRVLPIGLGTINATVIHVAMAEWFYVRRIAGLAVPPYDQWAFQYEKPPAFTVARAFWDEQAGETRRVLRGVSDWHAMIRYQTLPDPGEESREIKTTPDGIATQLVLHEVHHRAQLMAMLRQLGKPVEDLDFSTMTYARR
ncbi:MAG: DinB family protein [Phycisphaerales bacterium]